MALLIDAAYELFGFLLSPWVEVGQQPIERGRASVDQVGRIFDGLWRHTIHLDYYYNAAAADSEGGGPRTPTLTSRFPMVPDRLAYDYAPLEDEMSQAVSPWHERYGRVSLRC